MNKGLKLTDILVTVVISVVFGVVYKLWGPLYYAVKPFGLHLDQFLYGMWFIAAAVAFLIIRKPGVAVLAEMAAASGELIMGSEWGLETMIYGLVQGLFAELIFALFRYKRYDLPVLFLAAAASTVGSLIMDFWKGYIDELAAWNLTLYIGMRLIGALVIAGWFARVLVNALDATGVTRLVRPASREDWDSLDRE
ncbi:ECF transporter S component [Staphylospora marina]|uniref:ECF transporter S component n=1 Tax=Staphylospora marina TaxID=2490858 RepID=UPI001F1533D4|nr:ECF transporter S component [Staphylospora marina]